MGPLLSTSRQSQQVIIKITFGYDCNLTKATNVIVDITFAGWGNFCSFLKSVLNLAVRFVTSARSPASQMRRGNNQKQAKAMREAVGWRRCT